MNSEYVETWHGIIISPTWHVQNSRQGYGKNSTRFVYKLDNVFRSIRVSDENSSVTRALQCFWNLFELQTFFVFLCAIQRDVINFQHFLTSFAIFQSFTDLFRELNHYKIENHYNMNSESFETWHGIIISPTWHVNKSKGGHGKNWTHFAYKLGNLFRSIRVSDENSSVTLALHFFKLITTPDFFWVPYAPFKATSSIFKTFWHHLLFFSHLPICLDS